MADYTPYGLIQSMLPKQDYGFGGKTTVNTPLFNFNNSGFNAPVASPYYAKPAQAVVQKPVVQPKVVVVPKSAPILQKPKGLAQSASTLKAPPEMVSAAQQSVQPQAITAQPYANVTAGAVLPGVTPIGQTPQTGLAQYASTPETQQAYDTAAQQSANEFNVAQAEVAPPTTSNLFTDIGGAKGIADISGGLASLYSIYSGNQQNKRAQDALNMQKAEYNRGVAKDKAFASNIAKSGLGSYSAGA